MIPLESLPAWTRDAVWVAGQVFLALLTLREILRVVIPILARYAGTTAYGWDDRAVDSIRWFAGKLALALDFVQRWIPVAALTPNTSALPKDAAPRPPKRGGGSSGAVAGGSLSGGLALVLAFGLSGCGGGPETVERRAMQEVVLAGGRLLSAVDQEVGPLCEVQTSENIALLDAGDLTPDEFATAEAPCRRAGDLARLVRESLEDLEQAADRYEATRRADGFERVAPCVVGLVVELESLARRIAGYDGGAIVQTVRDGLEAFAGRQCVIPEYLLTEADR